MRRFANSQPFPTSCAMHENKTTAAILHFTKVESAPAAIEMARLSLENAAAHSNTPVVVLLGDGLSDPIAYSPANMKSISDFLSGRGALSDVVAPEHTHFVVSASDLALLRFLPASESSTLGELSRVPECISDVCSVPPKTGELDSAEVDRVIQTLRREPPIDFDGDTSQLPYSWESHVLHTRSLRWLEDLWTQTKADYKKAMAKKEDGVSEECLKVSPESPFDVLCLCTYAKMASMGFRTLDADMLNMRRVVAGVDGAMDAGLLDIFPSVDDDETHAPSFLEFLETYLIGEERPWELTTRGRTAAAKSRLVIERVFRHIEGIASLLSDAKLALVLHDMPGKSDTKDASRSAIVVHDGTSGKISKLISGRVPQRAYCDDRGFVVQFEELPSGASAMEWQDALNGSLSSLVAHVTGGGEGKHSHMRGLLGAFASLSSLYLEVDSSVYDLTAIPRLSEFAVSAITTFPPLSTAHLKRQLIIRDTSMKIASVQAIASTQSGHSSSCTHVTFCKKTASRLWAAPFDPSNIKGLDVMQCQRELDAIAKHMESVTDPLGVYAGTIGGTVLYEGTLRRLVGWRRSSDVNDSYISLVNSACIDVLFADYATSDRKLGLDLLEYENDNGPQTMPFMASETAIALPTRAIVSDTDALLFRLNSHGANAWLHSDKPTIDSLLRNTLVGESTQRDGFIALHTMESGNDRMCGISVQWARTHTPGGALHMLVSANTEYERVSY
jgi:hypothetical protein